MYVGTLVYRRGVTGERKSKHLFELGRKPILFFASLEANWVFSCAGAASKNLSNHVGEN